MKRAILTVATVAALVSFGASAAEVIKLWPNGAPNKSTITEAEYTNEKGAIFNVTEGRMEVTVPQTKGTKAVILIPGGGYGNLSMDSLNHKNIIRSKLQHIAAILSLPGLEIKGRHLNRLSI